MIIMKTYMVILLVLLTTTLCLSWKKVTKKMRKPTTTTDKNIKVAFWEKYGLKEEISLKSFKNILEGVGAFAKVRNCPLGKKRCDLKSIDYILPRLILKAAKKADLPGAEKLKGKCVLKDGQYLYVTNQSNGNDTVTTGATTFTNDEDE